MIICNRNPENGLSNSNSTVSSSAAVVLMTVVLMTLSLNPKVSNQLVVAHVLNHEQEVGEGKGISVRPLRTCVPAGPCLWRSWLWVGWVGSVGLTGIDGSAYPMLREVSCVRAYGSYHSVGVVQW